MNERRRLWVELVGVGFVVVAVADILGPGYGVLAAGGALIMAANFYMSGDNDDDSAPGGNDNAGP